MSLREIEGELVRFRDERDWKRYHTPKNLAISIAVELGELLEHFQWRENEEILASMNDPAERENVEDELADVLIYLVLLAHELGIDLEKAALKKIAKNARKYPVGGRE
ncbi:nucleotide pyrophosphohydrolase [Thermococcus waiotapuensis]|uniref:Nucleotide pyrophosphohydrolase n=1 Tax=Thermococcus waiotapuensis TaxID=90909 RepID=A0AAE4NVF0_9EURY|nr:nucleotide pyrophosphohydrolase [Thermococcus waiotapuensis]MDV3103563.1 nucleotide pyrophosphohydrolase [Thermococcus waiotapuensis]